MTVMELLVMMGIFGIVLAASLPGYRGMMEGFRHRGSVDRVTSRLFLTRQMAVRDKVPYILNLDTANDLINGFADANGNGVQDGGEAAVGPWQMDTDVSLVNVSWAGNTLTFFPNGSASQTADMRVIDNNGRTKTIRVSSITGNTEVLP
jgi:Tfp pilus assembly protein FimT